MAVPRCGTRPGCFYRLRNSFSNRYLEMEPQSFLWHPGSRPAVSACRSEKRTRRPCGPHGAAVPAGPCRLWGGGTGARGRGTPQGPGGRPVASGRAPEGILPHAGFGAHAAGLRAEGVISPASFRRAYAQQLASGEVSASWLNSPCLPRCSST